MTATQVDPWYRPMRARRTDQKERASTPLELLFDLCFVVAVAQAGIALEHEIEGGRLAHGVVGYLMVFFAIWWAWMNFTWFASAYDTDDVPYRLAVMVQIAGALMLAAGVQRSLEDNDFTVVTWAYALMRVAGVLQWVRAAVGDPERRRTDLTYAALITVVQIGWIARLPLPAGAQLPAFGILALADMMVPVVAERRARTTYHPRHIADRYGCFTVIVLGEAVTSAALAAKAGFDEGARGASLVVLAVMALLLLFSMWWLYFDHQAEERLSSLGGALFWGYLHYFVFAGLAAVGAGLSLALARETQEAPELSATVVGAAVTVPVAVYLLALWLLHRGTGNRPLEFVLPVAAVLVLACTFTGAPVHVTAVLMVVLVAVMLVLTRGVPGRVSAIIWRTQVNRRRGSSQRAR